MPIYHSIVPGREIIVPNRIPSFSVSRTVVMLVHNHCATTLYGIQLHCICDVLKYYSLSSRFNLLALTDSPVHFFESFQSEWTKFFP